MWKWWSKKDEQEVEVGKATVTVSFDGADDVMVPFTGHAYDYDFLGLVITPAENMAKKFVASKRPIEVSLSPGLSPVTGCGIRD